MLSIKTSDYSYTLAGIEDSADSNTLHTVTGLEERTKEEAARWIEGGISTAVSVCCSSSYIVRCGASGT